YLDVCKDRLYCDDKKDIHRLASQSAMALIAKKLISTLACILTYTMDELLEYAPAFIKDGCEDIFDFKKVELPEVESTLNEVVLLTAKEKFSEIKDALSKEKVIKSTLELMIYTNCEEILALDEVESSDWFLVSSVTNNKQNSDILGSFQIDGKDFEVYKAVAHKCPRCWKFTATAEETLCNRCEDVLK
ncbi:MAG: isoleucine--tRNA ligase, partial [Arcobacter sp.]|nr:isoleucine--tRNA ligase [Arcobacter sp.]